MILEALTGLLLGLFLVYIFDRIHYRLKLRRGTQIIERMKMLARSSRTNMPIEKQQRLQANTLLQLVNNWVLEIQAVGETQAALLRQLGLAKIAGEVIITNRELLSEIANVLRRSKLEPEYRLIPLPSGALEKLGELGIISLSFIEISSEIGPRFLFATTKTEMTDRISSDTELQNRFFILAGAQSELDVYGKRIILKDVKGGERGLKGIIVAEVVRSADRSRILNFLSKISTIPNSPEDAANKIRDAL
ncbi:MAG: hypothetical protein NDP24_04190 [Crenarchaeota archaeon]|nr:hypothetical protein [Thermoproteota archaeon]MCR8470554.1 hypothetical protein [Thermoproteota archaeon]MCR8472518.1 hypothetical protein [Thermoproteota archaeon]MCR8473079.1 hypothetical protein [Thermoproteota archaeon]MCR8487472.1 hypothetical protein [Thermoproteota archaeon]